MEFLNRVVYLRETTNWLKSIKSEKLEAMEISGELCKRWPFKSIRHLKFPRYDICAEPFVDEAGDVLQFDIILAEQIWEHLDRPYKAVQNVHAMLRPGGYFWLASPFFAKFHGAPVDCSRWSARGMKNLLIEAGFEADKIEAYQWGNRAAGRRDMKPSWAKYDPDRDSLDDDPNFPIMTWAMARR